MNPLLAQKYQKDDPTLKQKTSSAASLSKTPRNGGGGTESNSSLANLPASGGPKPNPKYWQFFRVSGKTREAKFLQYPLKPGIIFLINPHPN